MHNSPSAPRVGILMGSDSDLSVMEKAANVLKEMGVTHEVNILSAHRMPDATAEYAKTARARGLRIIICGAGMAAHLAGVVASHTTLPVIGVPIKSGALKGVDALYATVQMPPGVPVATVAIDGAANAAFLACEIIAVYDEDIAGRLENKREQIRALLAEKALKAKAKLQEPENQD
jgi:5-(carboxyamino)imidazole ribonucleotide mutase